MGRILFALREILPAACLLIPVYMLLQRTRFRDFRKSVLYYTFSLYLCAVYALVGLPNVTYFRFELSGNWIPFVGMMNGLRDYMLNVLLFVPLGVFLPLLWEAFRAVKNTVLFGFGMSLTIELLQIFTYRATDVNDLITNTVGTLLGYTLAKILLRFLPVGTGEKRDLVVVFGIPVCAMFFLQPIVWAML